MPSEAEGRIVVPVWVDGDVVKALIGDDGYMPVTIKNWLATQDVNIVGCDITVPVSTTDTSSSVRANSYGWVSSNWHKNTIQRGYSDVARSYLTATSTAGGSVYAETGVVPTDYIRVIEGCSVRHSAAAARHLWAGVWNGSSYFITLAYQSCAQYLFYGQPIDLTLKEGEKFFIGMNAGGAGETVSGYYACRQIYIGG